MPTIKVPKIKIPTVDIPPVPFVTEYVLTGVQPACDLVDRDLKITQNPSIVFHKRDQSITCPVNPVATDTPTETEEKPVAAPVFKPATSLKRTFKSIVYDEEDTIETEGSEEYKGEASAFKTVYIPPINVKKKTAEELYTPCPPKNAPYRKGDWRNELRLERLLKYERGLLDGSCNAVWEEVPWVDQYIPSASVTVSTALIASVAAIVPILLSVVKPLTKQIIKRIANVFKGKKNKGR